MVIPAKIVSQPGPGSTSIAIPSNRTVVPAVAIQTFRQRCQNQTRHRMRIGGDAMSSVGSGVGDASKVMTLWCQIPAFEAIAREP